MLCRMGRTDVIARGIIQLHTEEHLDIVARAMASIQSMEAVQATVQVSLAVASSSRSDVLADVRSSDAAFLGLDTKHCPCPGISQQ